MTETLPGWWSKARPVIWGLAILMISSELPEILGLSDRIAVMHSGTVVGTLDRADATQERVLELALGHRKAVPA
jgi:ABC-type sugar transport system ATPase subunit